jgi:hypothetical protein
MPEPEAPSVNGRAATATRTGTGYRDARQPRRAATATRTGTGYRDDAVAAARTGTPATRTGTPTTATARWLRPGPARS